MKKILIAVLLILSPIIKGQISSYSHPPMILGQREIIISTDSCLALNPDLLFIHDLDDSKSQTFSILAKEGANYNIEGNCIIPSHGFTGILHVNVQVKDGTFISDPYDMIVKVEEGKNAEKIKIIEQENIKIKENTSYNPSVSSFKIRKLPADFHAHFFVAPYGNDNNPGTKNKPLKSLEGARQKVKEYKNSHGVPKEGITVVFREGEYPITSTVKFEQNDSGEEDRYITYRAFPGEKVRFTGSKRIKHEWIEYPPQEILLKIKDPAARPFIRMVRLKDNGINEFGEIAHVGYGVRSNPIPPARIYIDGKAMHLCRYPNKRNFNDVSSPKGQKVFTSNTKVVKTWENTGDLWIDGALSKPWEWQKNKIKHISETGEVTMTWNFHSEIAQSEPKMFYFNMIEELDYPGEFFIDRTQGILYFYPPCHFDLNSDFRISQSKEPLILLDGTSYLCFKDIYFEGTRNSAIILQNNSNHNRFISCEIGCIGLDGIKINGKANQIRDSWIHDIGANGIYLAGGDQKTMTPARNLVENCKIHDFSQERRAYNPGLSLFGVGQVIRHCEIFNGPHMGIRIKGNNHLLEYNNIHHLPCEFSDMLAIYFNTGNSPLQRGTIIRRNRFHSVQGSWKQSAGVYMDNETCGVLVEENYFYDNGAESSGWSVMVHGGADNIVRKNVFVNTSYPYCISLRLNGYAASQFEARLKQWEKEFQNNSNKLHFEYYPELKHYFDNEGITPEPLKFIYNIEKDEEGKVTNYWDRRTPSTNVFTDNLVFNESDKVFRMPNRERVFYTVNGFRKINGKMQENLISSNNFYINHDPGFENYWTRNLNFNWEKLDNKLKQALPHLKFLPFKNMGLYNEPGINTKKYQIKEEPVEIIFLERKHKNYQIKGNRIIPKRHFSGELNIPLQVKFANGKISEIFELKASVLPN